MAPGAVQGRFGDVRLGRRPPKAERTFCSRRRCALAWALRYPSARTSRGSVCASAPASCLDVRVCQARTHCRSKGHANQLQGAKISQNSTNSVLSKALNGSIRGRKNMQLRPPQWPSRALPHRSPDTTAKQEFLNTQKP